MADVTAKCFIKGGNQENGRPFGWHVWEVYIPTGTLTQGQADTIVLPDIIKNRTVVLQAALQKTAGTSSSTGNFGVTLSTNEITIATGALANTTTLIAATDLDPGETEFLATGSTAMCDMWTEAAATEKDFKLSLSITPASTFTDGTTYLNVAVLMGRIDY